MGKADCFPLYNSLDELQSTLIIHVQRGLHWLQWTLQWQTEVEDFFPYLFEVVSFLAYTFPELAQLMYLVEPAMVSDDDESNDEAFCQEQ
jgi:hypothetical protein